MYTDKKSDISKLKEFNKNYKPKHKTTKNNYKEAPYYAVNYTRLVKLGMSKNEANEAIDRVSIQMKNHSHPYSSRLRHVSGNPIAVSKEPIMSVNKGLNKSNI